MHFLIPFAASHAPACQSTLPRLALPHLQKLLTRLTAQPLDVGDELSLSPPHERALAKLLGLPATDGLIPWAALHAQKQPDLVHLSDAWAFVTLCNWQASTHQVSMRQIPMRDLSPAESDQLLAAMAPFFKEDGITLYPDKTGRWLAHGAVFGQLASASPNRVLGRNLEPWMPKPKQASHFVRLLSEMQMLLYTHPINDERETRGALPVNAFWLSGTGVLTDTPQIAHIDPPNVITTLQDAALAEDWPAWAQAWQAFDAAAGRAMLEAHSRGESVQLTLCGERHAQTWLTEPQPLFQKMKRFFGTPTLSSELIKL